VRRPVQLTPFLFFSGAVLGADAARQESPGRNQSEIDNTLGHHSAEFCGDARWAWKACVILRADFVATDRRSNIIVLTDKGRAVMAHAPRSSSPPSRRAINEGRDPPIAPP